MAEKDQGADKTEKPTPKKIRDARKEGNVAKSRELTSTVLVLGWLVGGWLLMGFMYRKIQELFDASIAAVGQPFEVGVREVGYVAFDTLVWLSLPLLALALFLGVLVEFLQVGPIVTGKKLTPSLDKRSEEHTSELQSLMRNSYAVFCLQKKTRKHTHKYSRHKI